MTELSIKNDQGEILTCNPDHYLLKTDAACVNAGHWDETTETTAPCIDEVCQDCQHCALCECRCEE